MWNIRIEETYPTTNGRIQHRSEPLIVFNSRIILLLRMIMIIMLLSRYCITAEYLYTCNSSSSSTRNTQSNHRIVFSWIRQSPIILLRRDSGIQKHIPTTRSSSSSSSSSISVGGVMKAQYKQQQQQQSSIRMYSDHWNDDSHTNCHISSQRPSYRVLHSTFQQRQRQRLLLLMDRNNRKIIYMSKEDNENDMNRNRYSIQSDNNSNDPIRPIVRVVAAVPILLLVSLTWGSTINLLSLLVIGCTTIILFLILRTIATPLIQSSNDDEFSTMLLEKNDNEIDEEEMEVLPLQKMAN
jgi:hypothetical protein